MTHRTTGNSRRLLFTAIAAASMGLSTAAYSFEEGPINNFFGVGAGANNTGDLNSFFGGSAGYSNTSGWGNAFFGFNAGYNNTTAYNNAFFGVDTGFNTTTGGSNAFFGNYAGHENTTGWGNAFLGDHAGLSNTTGTHNAFFGAAAGYSNTTGEYNTFIGRSSGTIHQTGMGNTYIGANVIGPPNIENATAIGFRAFVSTDNSMVLGGIPGLNGAFEYVNVGIGTDAPDSALHVLRDDGSARIRVEDTGGIGNTPMLELIKNGNPNITFRNTNEFETWRISVNTMSSGNQAFSITRAQLLEPPRMRLQQNGDLEIAGTLFQGSSRTIKERITEMNAETVLSKLDRLPVHEWSYQSTPDSRHVGPMAEDFYAAFGLGHSDEHIAPGNLAGVALAAAKALNDRSARLEAENAELRERLARLEQALMDES